MTDDTASQQFDREVMQRLNSFSSRFGSRTAAAAIADDPVAQEMARNRAVNRRTAASAGDSGSAGSMQFATGRPRDPLFYWKQNNLPYDFSEEDELRRIRTYCRLLYTSHPIIASCIDIYTKYPLLGQELSCFGAETPVLTDQGVRPISELSGGVHRILTRGGVWVDGKFEEYGTQRLNRITLSRNGHTRVIYATDGHRWFVDEVHGPGAGSHQVGRHSSLTWEMVDQMRIEYAQGGVRQQDLAVKYGVTQPMIGRIVRGVSWTEQQRAQELLERKHSVTLERTTAELLPGDRLTSSYGRNLVFGTNPSPFGIARGMVFGDGALATSGGGSFVDLYGEKDANLLPYFAGCTIYDFGPQEGRNVQSVRVTNMPAYFKSEMPSLEESTSYLYGWLAGYFAADGTVSKKGEAFLDSVSLESVEHVRMICQRLGIRTYDRYEYTLDKPLPSGAVIKGWTGYRLPIDPTSLTEGFFLIPEHRARWAAAVAGGRKRLEDWFVESVEKTDRVETVYCAQVPGTESFTLEGNILTGNCKDDQLEDFYGDLFFSEEGLNYDEFNLDFGREYWTVGEAFPFGSFNESLGVWEDDELLNPDDVSVQRSPFLRDPRFFIKLPQTLREVLEKKSPAWEYNKLMQAYPELSSYASQDSLMPVSNILLRQYKFKGDTFNKRGVPILMRAMRSVMQEEMLNSAMDAIADRLYTPLLLVKLGASATDLGTTVPWIPNEGDLESFNESLDLAMSGDFRVLTHHFGIQMESVFGRENMPDFSADFERLEGRILQTFGLSQTMLSGASAGETYAADALNRDLVSQLLTSYQRMIISHFRARALVVAEAQEHYDFEERNGKRYVKMEEVLEVDEESGEERIVEQPKLLIPDLHFKSMKLSDDESHRQFLESMADAGVPISIKTRMINIPFELDEEIERTQGEKVQLAVAEQETRKAQFLALRSAGLPIPQDLLADFQPRANTTAADSAATTDARTPVMGLDQTMLTPNIAPTESDLAADQVVGVPVPGMGAIPVDPAAASEQGLAGDETQDAPPDVPEESNEMRAGMPKPASLVRQSSRMRQIARQHHQEPVYSDDTLAQDREPSGRFSTPKHVGMRRHASHVTDVLRGVPMDQWAARAYEYEEPSPN